MADYVTYSPSTLVTYTDGVDTFRDGSRDGVYVIDVALTSTGFAGTEDVDWENKEMKSGGGLSTFRDGIRGTAYVIDETITLTGFAGFEDDDWVNIETTEI